MLPDSIKEAGFGLVSTGMGDLELSGEKELQAWEFCRWRSSLTVEPMPQHSVRGPGSGRGDVFLNGHKS